MEEGGWSYYIISCFRFKKKKKIILKFSTISFFSVVVSTKLMGAHLWNVLYLCLSLGKCLSSGTIPTIQKCCWTIYMLSRISYQFFFLWWELRTDFSNLKMVYWVKYKLRLVRISKFGSLDVSYVFNLCYLPIPQLFSFFSVFSY